MVQKGKNDQFECKLNINYGFRFSNKTKKKSVQTIYLEMTVEEGRL